MNHYMIHACPQRMWYVEEFLVPSMHEQDIRPDEIENRHDDWFFRQFMQERHPDDLVVNEMPNLVDHIDFLIGGTVINPLRRIQVNRAEFFPDGYLVEELERKLKERNNG